MNDDLSNGWEAIAPDFISLRSRHIGAATVREWSKSLQPGSSLLDVGCGYGGPYTPALIDKGINMYGIDASPSLITEHQKRYPAVSVRCEAAEESDFFARSFDCVLSVGLLFLLSEEKQIRVLEKMANALLTNGALLFSSPSQVCEWDDLLTGRKSVSLGKEKYISLLKTHGLNLVDEYTDEGESHYYSFVKDK